MMGIDCVRWIGSSSDHLYGLQRQTRHTCAADLNSDGIAKVGEIPAIMVNDSRVHVNYWGVWRG